MLHWKRLFGALLLLEVFKRILSRIALGMIRAYQLLISPVIGPCCRFEPTCSVYAQQAFRELPPTQALFLTLRRLAKCRPGGSYGFDPLPKVSYNRKLQHG